MGLGPRGVFAAITVALSALAAVSSLPAGISDSPVFDAERNVVGFLDKMDSLFVKGLIVGFCLAAPVGPIAVLCLQRTTSKGRLAGYVSGLGAAAADAFYGGLAAFGVTVISEFLMAHRLLFQRAGGAILCLLGLRLLLTRPPEREGSDNGRGLTGDFVSTLALTLTNPMTFIAFAAVFATLGVGAVRGHSMLTAELVGGVFAGSALWWTLLVALVDVFRDRFGYRTLVWINRLAGLFVIGVGILYILVLRVEGNRAPGVLTRPRRAAARPAPAETTPVFTPTR